MMPCAHAGSKPWYRCGYTDGTPCRLGDAGSMTFSPWFVPRTKRSVQLHEVGPDRRHLLTESDSDVHLYVCRCRTGDADCCCCIVGNRRQNVTACTDVIFAQQRVLQQRVLLQQHQVLQQHVLLLLLRALQQHEKVVVHRKPSDQNVGGDELCE